MAETNKTELKKMDLEGYEIVTDAIQSLLDTYPGLEEGDKIVFSNLEETSGIAWYPVSGGAIEKEKKSVTGKVTQLCSYSFFIVYRSGSALPKRKVKIKEFLDSLGKWLERQQIKINEDTIQLKEYPSLSEGRRIEEIRRQTMAYLDSRTEDNIEDWVIGMNLKYKAEFYR